MTYMEHIPLMGDFLEVKVDVGIVPISPATHFEPSDGGAHIFALYIEGHKVDESQFPNLARHMATMAWEAYHTPDEDADYYYDRDREAV